MTLDTTYIALLANIEPSMAELLGALDPEKLEDEMIIAALMRSSDLADDDFLSSNEDGHRAFDMGHMTSIGESQMDSLAWAA